MKLEELTWNYYTNDGDDDDDEDGNITINGVEPGGHVVVGINLEWSCWEGEGFDNRLEIVERIVDGLNKLREGKEVKE